MQNWGKSSPGIHETEELVSDLRLAPLQQEQGPARRASNPRPRGAAGGAAFSSQTILQMQKSRPEGGLSKVMRQTRGRSGPSAAVGGK